VLVLTSFTPMDGALLVEHRAAPCHGPPERHQPGPDNRNIRNDAFTGQESPAGRRPQATYNFANAGAARVDHLVDKYDANDTRDQDFVDVPTLLYYPLANNRPAA